MTWLIFLLKEYIYLFLIMEEMLLYVAGFSLAGIAYEKIFRNNADKEDESVFMVGGGENENENEKPISHESKENKKSKEKHITRELIDLTSHKPPKNKSKEDAFELRSSGEKGVYFPVFKNLEDAKLNSPTESVHIVVPGLLPPPDYSWDNDTKLIYYMPNDTTPHKHGDAPHHMVEWNIDKVFEMYDLRFHNVSDKQLEKYRNKKEIVAFNNSEPKTAIETWINWRIPTDEVDYPNLIVKKGSIIWWDFFNSHNLVLVPNEEDYSNNNFDNSLELIDKEIVKQSIDFNLDSFDNDDEFDLESNDGDFLQSNEKEEDIEKESKDYSDSSRVVTIMNKRGTYYFACSIDDHAEKGHKIVIKVL